MKISAAASTIWNALKAVALGTTADTAAAGNHTHPAPTWGNVTGKPAAFAPAAHASSHAADGTDAITPAAIGAASATGLASEIARAGAAESANAAAILAETSRAKAAEAALVPQVLLLATPTAMAASSVFLGDDYTFPSGYIIDRILVKNTGTDAESDTDETLQLGTEVQLRLLDATGDYVAVGHAKASAGWQHVPVSLPLAFYESSSKLYVVINSEATPLISLQFRLIKM